LGVAPERNIAANIHVSDIRFGCYSLGPEWNQASGCKDNSRMTARNAPYWLALALIGLAAMALTIDVSVARFAHSQWVPGDIRKLLHISEVFAHGFGVGLILLTVAVLDRSSWPRLPRVAACTYGAGAIAQCTKWFVPRVRPYAFDLSSHVSLSFVAPDSAEGQTWLHAMQRGIQSFPSGHTAAAVGLAFGLTWLYPRGKWLFACFAILAACQRIETAAHFVSDTLAGAAIACLFAGLCLDPRAFGQLFSRLEQKHLPTSHSAPARCT
jgi:membrane-associated phospholipid phosphatase